MILHGDADKLVPIQQAEIFLARMKEVGATGELVVRKGAGHGWLVRGVPVERQTDDLAAHRPENREAGSPTRNPRHRDCWHDSQNKSNVGFQLAFGQSHDFRRRLNPRGDVKPITSVALDAVLRLTAGC